MDAKLGIESFAGACANATGMEDAASKPESKPPRIAHCRNFDLFIANRDI
jgi:hypothetical protein